MNFKFDDWSLGRKVESLREMNEMLQKMGVASLYTTWREWGYGLQPTKEKTEANWERIAKDDEAYINAVFCYMICTLEDFTLGGFKHANFKKPNQ